MWGRLSWWTLDHAKQREWLALGLFLVLGSGCAQAPHVGMPLDGLTPDQLQRFDDGQRLFETEFTPATGLGPLWNGRSCVECHALPEPGGVSRETEIHATRTLPDGSCDTLDELGGPVYQLEVTPALRAALGIDAEPVPREATGRALRRTPDIFGFGLLDAVPDDVLLELADPSDVDRDGISGRVNRFTDGSIGRFGRKAFVPTLAVFNEAALQIEQGITVPAIPDEGTIAGQPMPSGVDPLPEPELDAESVALIDDFVRFLAPPEPLEFSGAARIGEEIFLTIGCASCHVPSLPTGDHEVAALANREVWAYTDLLLHDMGPENADICLGEATESEFRTEPLMGLRFPERYMHDGSARTIDEAILKHGGEASRSREEYRRLLPVDRNALLEFLRRL